MWGWGHLPNLIWWKRVVSWKKDWNHWFKWTNPKIQKPRIFPQTPDCSVQIVFNGKIPLVADTTYWAKEWLIVTYVSNHSKRKQKHILFQWDLCLFLIGYLPFMLHEKDELINAATYLILDALRGLSDMLQTIWKSQLLSQEILLKWRISCLSVDWSVNL